MSEIRSILFVELLGGIGDVLIALPAIQALGRSHPTAQLTVLTFAAGAELLQANPLIHRLFCARPGAARQAVDHLLAEQRFDLIVSDTNYDGIAEAIHQSGSPRVVTNLWRSPPPDELVSDRFLKILLAEQVVTMDAVADNAQIYLTATERLNARQTLGASYRPVVFLCSDAGMAIKRWRSANFVALGQALQQQYGATVIVPIGSDMEEAKQIAGAIGGTAQVWPRGKLRSLAAAIAEADLLVAADTGIARVAAALQVPTITLFGPSWHGRYGQPAPHRNLQGFSNCPDRVISNFTEQPCWYSGTCPFEWHSCLEDISPTEVLAAAAPFLDKRGKEGGKDEGSRMKDEGKGKETEESRKEKQNTHLAQRYSNLLCSTASDEHPTAWQKPATSFRLPPSAFIPSWPTIRNLLVLRLDNIGDVMMTSPALRALRENLPDAKITLMASPSGTLAAPLLTWIDEVLTWRVLWQDLGRLDFDPQREWQLIDQLRSRQFDAAIIFTSFSQSPHPAALICALAGIPLRLGESKETDVGTLTHPLSPAPDEMHQVDRNLRLIESVGFNVRDRRLSLHVSEQVQKAAIERLQKSSTHSVPFPYLLLNPWTTCQSRNYAPDRFAAAARQLSEITGWPVVVTGVEKDRDRAQPLLAALGSCAIDRIGATDLSELVALVAGAKLVLTNNTSTMHIADATCTPNVILFAGTEQESQWRPRHSPSRLLRRPTVCSPCYCFICPYELQCLDISPETVVAAGLELLQTSAYALNS
jgi:ADP-heptose:LPS heptosyltransferase